MAKLEGMPVKGLLCDITGVLVESRFVLLSQLKLRHARIFLDDFL